MMFSTSGGTGKLILAQDTGNTFVLPTTVKASAGWAKDKKLQVHCHYDDEAVKVTGRLWYST